MTKASKEKAEQKAKEAAPWVVGLARFGYAAKGIVYAAIGVLAVQVAVGSGGQTTGQQGALQSLSNQPFGQVLLGIIAVGLFGYALWRVVQALRDPEHEGSDAKGLVKRTGFLISGLVYGGLALTAAQLLFGSSGSGKSRVETLTARLMSQPFGQWLVGAVGAIVIGVGVFQVYKGVTAKFREDLKLAQMSQREETWTTRAGRWGLSARGVVYGVIGALLIQAALQANPSQAGGLGQALDALTGQPYGPWLLGAVALGFIAYGVFAVLLARYRKITVS